MKFHRPQSISGVSQKNRIAVFSWTTEVDGDKVSSVARPAGPGLENISFPSLSHGQAYPPTSVSVRATVNISALKRV